MSKVRYLIIGGGYTGAAAAETLRQLDPQGSILLVGAEKELPYRRYTLSKEYIRHERARDRMPVHLGSFYRENDIEIRLAFERQPSISVVVKFNWMTVTR